MTQPEPADGRAPIERPGFSYLPQFIGKDEACALADYFGRLRPLWEQRHARSSHARSESTDRRLTRPVYWLGAWQFACLGYYAEPHYREHRCVRAEPLAPVMKSVLERLRNRIASRHHDPPSAAPVRLPNTCLINYYGREVGDGPPRDYARLRMHRDGEPGPVVMFTIGQAGLLEFLDPERSRVPELSLWTRHRSVSILSGPDFKDRLYHRITKVRTGAHPRLQSPLAGFELRRVSVSFRHVPDELIEDVCDLPASKREQVMPYVEQLARHSDHYRRQLREVPPRPVDAQADDSR